MKKILIGAVVAAAVAGGGYFAVNKATNSVADNVVSELVEQYSNQPVTVTYLQNHPFVKKAQWQITQSTETTINSLLQLTLLNDEALKIPFISQIVRGKTDYDGQSYGYGKIITTLDASQNLPPQITNDTLTVTKYIGLTGDVAAVTELNAMQFEDQNEKIDIQGATAVVHTSLLDTSAFSVDFNSKNITVNAGDSNEILNISPMIYSMTMDKNGAFSGKSEPMTFSVDEGGSQAFNIAFDKGQYNGIYKTVDGLNMPLNNQKAQFNNITVSVEGSTVQLDNVALDYGFYEADNQLLDLKFAVDADVAPQSLQGLGLDITPEHVTISNNLNSLSYQAINHYYETVGELSESLENEGEFDENSSKIMIKEMLRSGSHMTLDMMVKASEGNATAKGLLQFSDSGKNEAAENFLEANPQQLMQWVVANLDVDIDETIANATGLSMMLQMMLGVGPEDGKYHIKAEIKDGQALVNGQPMM